MQKNNKIYEQIDHTADMYIRVRGTALHNLFEKAAFALFDIMVELDNVREEASERIQLEGTDLPELMITWLNHLLFLWETKEILFKKFQVRILDHARLEAEAWGERFEPERHEFLTEIKAATYHNLVIEQTQGKWVAEIIFDL
jgi:SHS2 domain-containing protein